MRRILVLVTVALVMAAMVLATAMPAFAAGTCRQSSLPILECSVGSGEGGQGGGDGGNCSGNPLTEVEECRGGGSS